MAKPTTCPFDLSETPIHLAALAGGEHGALPLPDFGFDGPSFGAYVEEHTTDASPGRLIMIEVTPSDWPVWECHTLGDEIVIVLEGKGVFLQEIACETLRMPVEAGSALINPAGVWHTADVEEPLRAIYMTPCRGTEHRTR